MSEPLASTVESYFSVYVLMPETSVTPSAIPLTVDVLVHVEPTWSGTARISAAGVYVSSVCGDAFVGLTTPCRRSAAAVP